VSFQEKSVAAMTAHALLLAWVLAELTRGAVRIVLYRRGG
jgi:hypothetical protein